MTIQEPKSATENKKFWTRPDYGKPDAKTQEDFQGKDAPNRLKKLDEETRYGAGLYRLEKPLGSPDKSGK